ncbi:MAG: FHA domain-containing protein [Desulfobulbaceae bacterium]|nr:FHA domain-containing protein [Desulfobulbaceae bacterium]
MAALTLRFNRKMLGTYQLQDGMELHIGRSAVCDIVISSKAVSARHAMITSDHDGFIIKDVGSRNGTCVAGKTIKAHRLCHEDVVSIGGHELVFDEQLETQEKKVNSPGGITMVLDELDQFVNASKAEKEKESVAPVPTVEDKVPLLIVKFKKKVLYKYQLKDEKTEIGRGADNKIIFDNVAVSTHHALVVREGADFVVLDGNSKNGTFVNDKKIKRHSLQAGDVIVVGRHELVFEKEGGYASTKLYQPSADPFLTVDDTKVLDTRKYKEMLHKGNGEVASGKAVLVYLSGGSGEVPIDKNVLSIGTGNACDIVAKGILVGENAALVLVKQGGYHLMYNKGIAKPTVNGVKINGSKKLYDGDVIKIGSVTLRFGL